MNITADHLRNLRTKLPTYVVFGAAAWQSFGHAISLASAHGASDPWLLPVSIDGLMVVAFHHLTHGKTPTARRVAGAVLGFAMTAMLTINYLAAPVGDVIGQAVSVLPAAGMILTTVLMHMVPTAKAPQRRRKAPVARARGNVTPMRKRAAAAN
jgi:hypothetical protein